MRKTPEYPGGVALWPGSILRWDSETMRATVPGETRTLVETFFVDLLAYVRGLSDFTDTDPPFVSNTNIENLIAYITGLSAALTFGLDTAGDDAMLVSLVKGMAHNHQVYTRAFDVNLTLIATGNPTVITAPGHGALAGFPVRVSGITGNSPNINGNEYVPTAIVGNDISLPVNTTVAGTGGKVVVSDWGGLITSPRMAAELAEAVIRHTADLGATEITEAKAIVAHEASYLNISLDPRVARWMVVPSDVQPFSLDTESESMSWAARAAHASLRWQPGHADAGTWTTQLPLFNGATYALGSLVDGVPTSEDGLAGFNGWRNYYPGSGIEIPNHGLRQHPRYMASGIQAFGGQRRVSRLTGHGYQSMVHADEVYQTIVAKLYTADGGVRFPVGDDIARRRLEQWALSDLIAAESGWATPEATFASARSKFALMQFLQDENPAGDGRIFTVDDVAPTADPGQEYRVLHKLAESLFHLEYLESVGIT